MNRSVPRFVIVAIMAALLAAGFYLSHAGEGSAFPDANGYTYQIRLAIA